MLARVGEDEAWLRQSPRVNRLRLRLLGKALGGYRELLAATTDRSDDHCAKRLERCAVPATSLRNWVWPTKPAAISKKPSGSFATCGFIRQGRTSRPAIWPNASTVGATCLRCGNLAGSRSKHRAALDCVKDWRRGPGRTESRRDVARSLINIANVTRRSVRAAMPTPNEYYRRAVDDFRAEVVAVTDSRAAERRLLALALNNQGLFLRNTTQCPKREATCPNR